MTAVNPIVITTTFPTLSQARASTLERSQAPLPLREPEWGGHFPTLERPDCFVADLGDGLAAVLLAIETRKWLTPQKVRDSTGEILTHRVPRGSGVTLASCAGGIPPAECASVTSRPASRLSAGLVDSESGRRGDVGQLVDGQHPAILDIEDGAVLGRDSLVDNPNEARARWLVGASDDYIQQTSSTVRRNRPGPPCFDGRISDTVGLSVQPEIATSVDEVLVIPATTTPAPTMTARLMTDVLQRGMGR